MPWQMEKIHLPARSKARIISSRTSSFRRYSGARPPSSIDGVVVFDPHGGEIQVGFHAVARALHVGVPPGLEIVHHQVKAAARGGGHGGLPALLLKTVQGVQGLVGFAAVAGDNQKFRHESRSTRLRGLGGRLALQFAQDGCNMYLRAIDAREIDIGLVEESWKGRCRRARSRPPAVRGPCRESVARPSVPPSTGLHVGLVDLLDLGRRKGTTTSIPSSMPNMLDSTRVAGAEERDLAIAGRAYGCRDFVHDIDQRQGRNGKEFAYADVRRDGGDGRHLRTPARQAADQARRSSGPAPQVVALHKDRACQISAWTIMRNSPASRRDSSL